MSTELGPRLAAVCAGVPDEGGVADLGCDHARVAAAVAAASPARRVIAADISAGAVAAARATRDRSTSPFEVRRGDGISVLEPGEVSTVVIAGVGGYSMLEMLRIPPFARPDDTGDALARLGVDRLVLQPQAAARALRVALHDAGWRFRDERLVTDHGRTYVVIVTTRLEHGTLGLAGPLDAEFGPCIRHRPGPVYLDFLTEEHRRWTWLAQRASGQGAPPASVHRFEKRVEVLDGERRRVERIVRGS